VADSLRCGPCTPPGLKPCDPGLLFGQQLSSELADLRQAAFPNLGGGEHGASAVTCRHDLDERKVEGSPVEARQSFQVAATQAVAPPMAVAVRREPTLGQPLDELGSVRLAAPVDAIGELGEMWIGELVAGERGD
jgi:hypothetical protein